MHWFNVLTLVVLITACAPRVDNTIPPPGADEIRYSVRQVSNPGENDVRSKLAGSETDSTLSSFAKDEYWTARPGARQLMPEELAPVIRDDPLKAFRSPKSYQLFKFGFELRLERKLTDGQLADLLESDQVTTRACAPGERFETTGTDVTGHVKWFGRECRKDERVIQLVIHGTPVDVALTGCLNLVNKPLLVVTKIPAPCSQWHPLPERAPAYQPLTWVYTQNRTELERCNPRLTLCPDCEDFLAGNRDFKPPQELLEFMGAGSNSRALKTSQRPTGFWMDPGSKLHYCLQAWGRGSRVDPLPAGKPPGS